MTPDDIEVAFAQAIREAGIGDTVIPADGRLHRFPTLDDRRGKRCGWAVLHADGAPSGIAGDWRTGERITWRPPGPVGPKVLASIREAQQRRQREDRSRWARAAAKAVALLARLPAAPADHPYLVRKGIEPRPCRITCNDALVVPVADAETDQIISLQYIRPDGEKRFLVGGRTSGGCCVLGDLNSDGTVRLNDFRNLHVVPNAASFGAIE